MKRKILIYTKKPDDLESLIRVLEGEGCSVSIARERQKAADRLLEKVFHMFIIDDRGGERESILLTKEIRKRSAVPVLIISKRGSGYAMIEALNAGADDFVTCPFHVYEVSARVHSQIRRYTQLTNLCENINHIYRVRDLIVDDIRRKVTVGGKEVRLTPIEYKILKLLVQEKGKVFSIDQIYETIWNMQAIGVDNTIAVHIRHIREKIEENPREPEYLKVVWGTGYKVG